MRLFRQVSNFVERLRERDSVFVVAVLGVRCSGSRGFLDFSRTPEDAP